MKSRQAEFDRGHTILNKLVNVGLLENCEIYSEKCVKMHDLVRDMALQITSNIPGILVEAGKGLGSIPNEELWKEDLTKVSLIGNSIDKIPPTFDPPNCPKLSTLLLQRSGLTCISEDFFRHMKGLVLLDLSYMDIKILPNSISELVNLSVLLLRCCIGLENIPSLAKLRELKKLDLHGYSGVYGVPPLGLGDLVELRYLNLLPDADDVYTESWVGVTKKDIMQLRKLENLSCIFRSVDCFNAYATSLEERGPTVYELYVVHDYRIMVEDLKYLSRAVGLRSLQMCKGKALLLPKCAECLSIRECSMEAGSLCDVVPLTSVINLRSLRIEEFVGIEYLFDYSNTNIFRTIEALVVGGVRNLVGMICGGQGLMFPHVSFSSLKTLHLDGFHVGIGNYSMERLFRNAEFPNLETLLVIGFKLLVEITSTTTEGGHDFPVIVTLPKLLRLELRYLPSLLSVSVISDVVQYVEIYDCPKLRRIPLLDREQLPTSLQEVFIDWVTMESLKWDHPNAKDEITERFASTVQKRGFKLQ